MVSVVPAVVLFFDFSSSVNVPCPRAVDIRNNSILVGGKATVYRSYPRPDWADRRFKNRGSILPLLGVWLSDLGAGCSLRSN